MDDGDLGQPIEQVADEVDHALPAYQRFQHDEAHLQPSRWWFASSAFPLVAGTLGPVASAFSICALVRPWRQHFPPGTLVAEAKFISDPPWLTSVNAIQLVVALVANAFLLLNMARRVRFDVAQPITMVGWYVSAVCLIALTATASGPLLQSVPKDIPQDEVIWSQAFWYGIWAAILYFIDASLMAVNFWGARTGHYPRDFTLTNSQRTLMLQTIMFLMYLLLGALLFSKIEGWDYLDGVYWADVTLFTVGFGDLAASTSTGRGLLFPYALIGVISLGLVIGSIRSMVLERGKRRLDARMEEKKRRQTIRRMTTLGRDDVLEPVKTTTTSSPSNDDEDEPSPGTADGTWTEFERRRAEFQLMRQIQERAAFRRRWVAMGISSGSMVILWIIGAVIFWVAERSYQPFTYYNGIYFGFVSFTTIGYGDVTPVSPCGKSFFVFWSLLTLPAMTILISNAGDTVVAFIRDATIHLGHITILPDEEGFEKNVKHFLNRISFGLLFKPGKILPTPEDKERRADQLRQSNQADKQTSSAGEDNALTNQHPVDIQADKNTGEMTRGRSSQIDVEQGPPERMVSTYTARVRRSLSRIRDPFDDNLPEGSGFHFLLISEIKAVTKHLQHKAPKKYSYEEWAWYLKLIGEDERIPDTHRKPKPKEDKTRIEDIKDPNDERLKWSWVGNRSPLMGGQEESEWILDRLMDRLLESISFEGRKKSPELRRSYKRDDEKNASP